MATLAPNRPLIGFPPLGGERILKKGDPKIFFSNERTLLRWLNTSVFLGALGAGIGGLSTSWHGHRRAQGQAEAGAIVARLVGLASLLLSVIITFHAARTFYLRDKRLMRRADSGYDDLVGPVVLGGTMLVLLIVMLTAYVTLTVKQVVG